MRTHDLGSVLGTLQQGNVLFIVVGDPTDGRPLRLIVSQHPTNLDVLGTVLDRLGSQVRPTGASGDPDGVQKVGDPLGTVGVTTERGDIDLLFGGAQRSLYAETLQLAEEREIGGVRVQWAPAPAVIEPARRATRRSRSKRLLSLAEDIALLMEREREEAGADEGSDADPGNRPDAP